MSETSSADLDPQSEIDQIMNELERLQDDIMHVGDSDDAAASDDANASASEDSPPAQATADEFAVPANNTEEASQDAAPEISDPADGPEITDVDAALAEIGEAMEEVAAATPEENAPAEEEMESIAAALQSEEDEAKKVAEMEAALDELENTLGEGDTKNEEATPAVAAVPDSAEESLESPSTELAQAAESVEASFAEGDMQIEELAGELKADEQQLEEAVESAVLREVSDEHEELQQAETESTGGILDQITVDDQHAQEMDTPEHAPMMISHDDGGENLEAGTLAMQISGQIKLRLNYSTGGQNVDIQFVDDHLVIHLDNGAEFKIPLQSMSSLPKAA